MRLIFQGFFRLVNRERLLAAGFTFLLLNASDSVVAQSFIAPTCILGNRPPFTKNTFTPSKSTQIATINSVISIVSSISFNFAGAKIEVCTNNTTIFALKKKKEDKSIHLFNYIYSKKRHKTSSIHTRHGTKEFEIGQGIPLF